MEKITILFALIFSFSSAIPLDPNLDFYMLKLLSLQHDVNGILTCVTVP